MATLTISFNDVTEDYLDFVNATNVIYQETSGNEPRWNGFGADALQPGYRAFVAREGESVVGFCYGYDLPEPLSNWWALSASRYADPVLLGNTRVLAELHVWPAAQRRGLGSTLLKMWLDSGTTPAVLSAYDTDSPARHLYDKFGFVVIAEKAIFPGDEHPFVIMRRDIKE